MRSELSEEIQRFEEKYAENPDSLVFARLADLYRKSGEPDRALNVLEEGLERHPEYLSAHIVRARCLRDLGREREAERSFERVLEQDEQNLVALRELAELARERGAPEEAERRYRAVLAVDPHNEEARSHLEEVGGAVPAEGAGGAEAPEDAADVAGAGEAAQQAASHAPGEDAAEPEDEGPRDEAPWWRAGEEPGADEPPPDEGGGAAPEDAPAGAGQSDVFRLADPAEEGGGASAGGEAVPGAERESPPADPSAPGPASREEAEFLGLEEGDAAGAGAAGEEDLPPGEEDLAPGEEDPSPGEDREEGPSAGEEALPAEEGLTDRIEEIADTEDGAAGDAEPDAEDLLTETLADLYETQGFHREAVEMYEELLEERPDDEDLRGRLEAARVAMGGDAPDSGAGEDDPSPGAPGGSASAPEAPAEPEPGADDRAGEGAATARAHVRALLRGEARPLEGASPAGPDPGP